MTQGLWLDAPGLALILLKVSGFDWCWLQRFLASVLRVIYHKDAHMSHEYQCNAWGEKAVRCTIYLY
jgi:hypothetical protein